LTIGGKREKASQHTGRPSANTPLLSTTPSKKRKNRYRQSRCNVHPSRTLIRQELGFVGVVFGLRALGIEKGKKNNNNKQTNKKGSGGNPQNSS